jgi:hypothetical protein
MNRRGGNKPPPLPPPQKMVSYVAFGFRNLVEGLKIKKKYSQQCFSKKLP